MASASASNGVEPMRTAQKLNLESFRTRSSDDTNAALEIVRFENNQWREKVADNKWSIPIREDATFATGAVDLQPFHSFGTKSPISNVHMRTMHGSLGFLSHLLERGKYSNQVYMIEGSNHRELDMAEWHSVAQDKPCTMIESCVYGGSDDTRLDMNDPVSMFFHGVMDPETNGFGDCEVKLRSQCELTGVDPSKPKRGSVSGLSFASDRRVCRMTGGMFKRLLRVFNHRWVKADNTEHSDSDVVTFSDLAAFVNLFRDCDFSCYEGFKEFYNKFKLSEVFDLPEDNGDIFDLHAKFGRLLRALVPVRVAIYDGQHRMLLLALFITGNLEPEASIPLRTLTWAESMYSDMPITNLQTFIPLAFHIGIPMRKVADKFVDMTDLPTLVEHLKEAGRIITEGSNMAIDVTWSEFFVNVMRILDTPRYLEILDHDSYWSNNLKDNDSAAFVSVMTAIHAAIAKVLKAHNRFKRLLVGSDNSLDDVTEETVMRNLKSAMELQSSMTSNAQLKVEVKELIQVFRCVAFTKAGRKLFKGFYQLPRTVIPQRCGKDINRLMGRFRSPAWTRGNIFKIAEKVTSHMIDKFSLERFIIQELRKKGEGLSETVVAGLDDGSLKWPDGTFEKYPSAGELKSKSGQALNKRLNLGSKGGGLVAKVKFGIWAGVVRDIYKAINVYGFDPDFINWPVAKRNQSKKDTTSSRSKNNKYQKEWKNCVKSMKDKFLKEGYKTCKAEWLPRGHGLTRITKDTYLVPPGEVDDDDEEEKKEDEKKSKKAPRLYNIYFDVLNEYHNRFKDAEDMADAFGFLYNNVVREYLDTSRQTEFSTYHHSKTEKKGDNARKYSMELLLHLYPEYVARQLPLTEQSIVLLKGSEGNHAKMKSGAAVDDGCGMSQRRNGLDDRTKNAPRDIVPEELGFSVFCQLVLTDRYDTDEFTGINEQCTGSSNWLQDLKSIRSQCAVRSGFESDNGPDVTKFIQTESNYFVTEMKSAFSVSKGDHFLNKDTAVTAFKFLCERGLITSVKFNIPETKHLFQKARYQELVKGDIPLNSAGQEQDPLDKVQDLEEIIPNDDTGSPLCDPEVPLLTMLRKLPTFESHAKAKKDATEKSKAAAKSAEENDKEERAAMQENATDNSDSDVSPTQTRNRPTPSKTPCYDVDNDTEYWYNIPTESDTTRKLFDSTVKSKLQEMEKLDAAGKERQKKRKATDNGETPINKAQRVNLTDEDLTTPNSKEPEEAAVRNVHEREMEVERDLDPALDENFSTAEQKVRHCMRSVQELQDSLQGNPTPKKSAKTRLETKLKKARKDLDVAVEAMKEESLAQFKQVTPGNV